VWLLLLARAVDWANNWRAPWRKAGARVALASRRLDRLKDLRARSEGEGG